MFMTIRTISPWICLINLFVYRILVNISYIIDMFLNLYILRF